MHQTIENIFYGPAVTGFGLAVIVFQVVLLVTAVRRRRRGGPPLLLTLHAIAAAAIAALPILVGASVHAARALMLTPFSSDSPDPSEMAIAVSRGLTGQMSAIPLAINLTGLALVLWFVGLAYTTGTPRADGRARSLPPVALIGVGLIPVAFGGLRWATRLIGTFAALAGVAPEKKGAILEQALVAARAELTFFARVSMAVIPMMAVIAVVLIVARARGRDAAATTAPAPTPARLPLALSAAAILLAALFFLEARPMAAENDLPWPPSDGSQLVNPRPPPTPELAGPDAPERAPVVEVFSDRLSLDGMANEDFESLESKLTTLRNNFRLLNPGADFNEMALILADPATPIPRLTSVLQAIRRAWYYRPMFAFARKETHVRPVMGKLERVRITGARIKLAFTDDEEDEDPGEWRNAVPLHLPDFADYGAFARRLVELRRAGKPVIVKIDRAPPP